MKHFLSFVGPAFLFLGAVHGQDDFSIASTTSSQVPLTQDAQYSCEFINRWSSARHPNQYPSNAHWSPPVMATHNGGYEMWAPGELASTGVERVAETGATQLLRNEIQSSSDTGNFVIGSVMFNSQARQQTLPSLNVNADLPLISSITMIAPSPDWFSGFYDFDPRDLSSNTWYGEFTIETYPWDAGTETGNSYSLSNDPESTNIPILRLDEETVPQSTGVFLSQAGTTVLPVARWQCKLLTEVEACKKGRHRCESNDECCSGFCIPLGTISECDSEKDIRGGTANKESQKLPDSGDGTNRKRGGARIRGRK